MTPRARISACFGALSLAALVAMACAAGAVAGSSATRMSHARSFVLYATAEQEQYVDNSDSLTRGQGNNPFGNYKDLAPLANKNAAGPFPGDEALFSFNLYSDAGLKARVGTAIFTCQYNLNKNAFCDASFQFTKGGTLMTSGAFNFTASKFSLAVVGGYGAYVNRRGSLLDTPSANHSQKITFQFT